jgi:hypothetical protein
LPRLAGVALAGLRLGTRAGAAPQKSA